MFRSFGKNPSGNRLKHLSEALNFKKNGFENLTATPMIAEDASYTKMLRDFFKPIKNSTPSTRLPSVKTDLKNITTKNPFLVWFGHSSYFMKIAGKNFLIDPVFSGHASPFSFMVKAFAGADVYTVDDLPQIDYLVLTHDHYDHLDYKTVRELRLKTSQVICSAGVGSHLEFWGWDVAKIVELNWWQSLQLNEVISITATPARHFSGRSTKRGQTLWSSFVLHTGTHQLFLGGDSGYDTHFKQIGEKFGPFDLVILECGQYNKSWPYIHMMPEDTVKAALDLKARLLLPVHWAKFKLALHEWNDPIKRVTAAAASANLPITTPMIGEPLILGESIPAKVWWN